jgi:hypothetical protein
MDEIPIWRLAMFDEFFYRRRRNKGLLVLMIALMLMGAGLFALGFLYLF